MRKTPLRRGGSLKRTKPLISGAISSRNPSRSGTPTIGAYIDLPAKPASPRRAGLKPRSDKTARKYITRRQIVAELFTESSICEVPWCTSVATDPHEPLTRARGGDILDRDNIRKVCHPHNVMFAHDEQPWMYDLGFLVHSWDGAA